jgi:hypothetical protein
MNAARGQEPVAACVARGPTALPRGPGFAHPCASLYLPTSVWVAARAKIRDVQGRTSAAEDRMSRELHPGNCSCIALPSAVPGGRLHIKSAPGDLRRCAGLALRFLHRARSGPHILVRAFAAPIVAAHPSQRLKNRRREPNSPAAHNAARARSGASHFDLLM